MLIYFSDDDMEHNMFIGPNGQVHMGSHMIGPKPGVPNAGSACAWQDSSRAQNFNMSLQFGAAAPLKSVQSDIVNNRKDQISEHFGQITPPYEPERRSMGIPLPKEVEGARKVQEEDIAKQSRTQRARNAANERHSKPQVAKQDAAKDGGGENGDAGRFKGKNAALQREKNRVAAAKCRAKKKAISEEMQETYHENVRRNAYMQREVRELRYHKAYLRNSLLQHESGICRCHAIHRFNRAQAQQSALGAWADGNTATVTIPREPGAVPTPASDASMDRSSQLLGPRGPSRKMHKDVSLM